MRPRRARPSVDPMIEMAPQITEGEQTVRTEVVVHELEPLANLPVGICEHTLYVSSGVVYVVLHEDELALTAGDQIGVRRGELRRAWNAGEETARVVVATRSPVSHR
jgi:quercetin dioxygenase-like cupin family protein